MPAPFQFEYIAKDEQLLSSPQILLLDPKTVEVQGVKTVAVFDMRRAGTFNMIGFFIKVFGIEYGSISIDPAAIYSLLTKCGCPQRIHTSQFGIQFN